MMPSLDTVVVDDQAIKERVEALIDREFLERSEDDMYAA